MADHGYLGEPPGSWAPKHSYRCPRLGCKYETTAYTMAGMMRLADEHRAQHKREDAERLQSYVFLQKDPKEYEVLKLTWADMCFLVTRGVKVDEAIELDKSNPKAVDGKDHVWRFNN